MLVTGLCVSVNQFFLPKGIYRIIKYNSLTPSHIDTMAVTGVSTFIHSH